MRAHLCYYLVKLCFHAYPQNTVHALFNIEYLAIAIEMLMGNKIII